MAAARAATRFANQEAVKMLDRGLSVVEHLPTGRARSEAEIDLRLAGLAALLPLGEQERILRTLFDAEAIAASISDPRRLAAVHSQISAALWMAGRHERALESARRALVLAEEHKQFGLRLTARGGLVQAHHALGELHQCAEVARGVMSELSGDLEMKRFGWAVYPSVLCASFLGSALTLVGKFDEALRELDRGVALANATRHPLSRALVLHELGTLYYMRGDAQQALHVFDTAMDAAREGDVFTMYAPIVGWRGAALTELGRCGEAIQTIEEVIGTRTARAAGHYAKYFMLNGLAAAYARAGRLDDALAAAQDAVECTSATREYVHLGHALLRLAGIQAQRGGASVEDGVKTYSAALARAAAHGMRPLEAECHEGLGRLRLSLGDTRAAREEFGVAAGLYAEVDLRERAKGLRKAPIA
jgi:tetratricopeptide (TPR) repeat protein